MAQETAQRETWGLRSAFILAAIGSAVGLGNIWRFPYIAYESGGGAFLIPYLVALLTAGIPFLFFDYAIGHRMRSGAPLAMRRMSRFAEPIGWVQVIINILIAVYYAVIVAWAGMFTWYSVNQSWGEEPEAFFMNDFLQYDAEAPAWSFDFVGTLTIVLAVVWILVILIMALGVQRGISAVSKFFVPMLIVLFVIMVVRALFLTGASTGLEAFFTPDWSALTNPTVWVNAYGQIFFSLSIAFGIMITYSSYLKPRTNLTGSGLVVGFSNSAFEVLAGIGVFATLGYLAVSSGVAVDEVAGSGIGLAFIAFPSIISMMPGGALFGVLFFGCLVLAGFTSLISIVEVIVAAIQDKFAMSRRSASIGTGVVLAVLSLAFFPTTSGLTTLDIVDKFVNSVGIVGIAVVSLISVGWLMRKMPMLRDHLNSVSSFRVGWIWLICTTIITPIVLGIMFGQELKTLITEGYGGYDALDIAVFGWGSVAFMIVGSILFSLIPWPKGTKIDGPVEEYLPENTPAETK